MTTLTLPVDQHALTVRARALVFEDPLSQALLRRIQYVAPSEATVLIAGETGTGKELVARHVHALSGRASGPFVAINCGAFNETLVESELFGHERGAFTGAAAARPGWFEAADGGTLFLDEVGDLPPPAQVKLLRVLQEREVVRLGSRQAIPIDVRLVAATNVKLEQAVAAGRFREDLYYRLKVAVVEVPPLRERPGDVLPLAAHFLALHRRRLGAGPSTLSAEARFRLMGHSWPGNVRELENAIHAALLVGQGAELASEDLPLGPAPRPASVPGALAAADPLAALSEALLTLYEGSLPGLHAAVEATLIRTAYHYCHGNQLQTARLLGISRNVVRARLIALGELPSAERRLAS
jgi:sigma-54 dependent transcriptional regulator